MGFKKPVHESAVTLYGLFIIGKVPLRSGVERYSLKVQVDKGWCGGWSSLSTLLDLESPRRYTPGCVNKEVSCFCCGECTCKS